VNSARQGLNVFIAAHSSIGSVIIAPSMPSSLEEMIAQLEATLEAAYDGIVVVGNDRRFVRSNRRFTEMFGFPREMAARGSAVEMIGFMADQLEAADAEILRSDSLWRENPASATGRQQLRFKDGRVVERFVAPQRVGDAVVGRVVSYRDVSESVRHAQALEQHREFLERAQQVAHIGSWVSDLDESARVGYSSETGRIFGVTPNRFDGTSAAFFAFVHEDDRAAVRAAAEAAIAPGGPPYDIEHRIVRSDGAVRWVHGKADVLRDGSGAAIRMIGTVQDITDRRLLEEQLRQLQKMEAIGRLAGGIAHDLNNALTAISGFAELALGALPPDHRARPDVEEVRRGAERAASVTRQLLAFSRKRMLQPRRFDVNDTVASMARLLSRVIGPEVRVTARAADDPLTVVGDPGQIEQAIINLAINAKDAMPGGGELTLSTAVERIDETDVKARLPMPPGSYVVVRAADTGAGMSPETQARAFEPFFTTKGAGKGTGLGLSMVYGTMKQCGGFVFIDSEVDRGTTIALYFPEAPEPAVAAAGPQTAGGGTVLVVDDEPAVRTLVASTLRADPVRVLLATSAEDAIAVAGAHHGDIDLLLTDAVMPGKSGIELARLLVSERPGLRVLIMTGYTPDAIGMDELPQPVDVLQKPFSPGDLRKRVRAALDR